MLQTVLRCMQEISKTTMLTIRAEAKPTGMRMVNMRSKRKPMERCMRLWRTRMRRRICRVQRMQRIRRIHRIRRDHRITESEPVTKTVRFYGE